MKKILLVLVLFLFSSTAFAAAIKKSGFVDKKIKVNTKLEVSDPSNKIIIIYNHGSNETDRKTKGCFWTNTVRNMASLVGDKVNGKEIMVYLLCTHKLQGDMGKKKNVWHNWQPPYKGTTKIERRVEANLNLVENFVSMGVPRKQIIITGHSCGGWTTLMLTSQYMDKVGGGIALNAACYWTLSKQFKVAEIGEEAALEKFAKKYPGLKALRDTQINIIKKSKSLPILVFTHPKDPYEGLLFDWIEKIPEVKRIIISEGFEIDGVKCKVGSKSLKKKGWPGGHEIDLADCFQYYNPVIKEYIASRIN
jgi:hypothetical protein